MSRLGFFLSVLLAASGCGPAEEEPTSPTTFIALLRDFQNFETWEAFTWREEATASTHVPGERTVYLKSRPPSGSTEFPLGSLIVKVTRPDATSEPVQTFGMAKRGGGFNDSGASGWEWFELEKSTSGQPVIVWRGVGAPAGHRYSQVDTSCNDCHQQGKNNDFVLSSRLQLSGF